MGLYGKAGTGHHFFLSTEYFAQGFNLRIHAIEDLLDGIDAQFTALIAVESEANCYVLRQLEQHWLVWSLGGRLGGQTGQGLLQCMLCANGHGAEPGLKCGHIHAGIRALARLSKLREQA